MTDELIGKTIASVDETSMVARDITYGEEVSFERVTLTFTDGTSVSYDLSNVDFDAETVSARDRVCPSCHRSFDTANYDCWLEDVHTREAHANLPDGPVAVLAGHRQSWDNPDTFGPFDSFEEAREFVIEQVRDGDWDPDGVTIEFSPIAKPRKVMTP